jgi:hypothetical protein
MERTVLGATMKSAGMKEMSNRMKKDEKNRDGE